MKYCFSDNKNHCKRLAVTTNEHSMKYKKVKRKFYENRAKCVFKLMLPSNAVKKNYHNFKQLDERKTNQKQFAGSN